MVFKGCQNEKWYVLATPTKKGYQNENLRFGNPKVAKRVAKTGFYDLVATPTKTVPPTGVRYGLATLLCGGSQPSTVGADKAARQPCALMACACWHPAAQKRKFERTIQE